MVALSEDGLLQAWGNNSVNSIYIILAYETRAGVCIELYLLELMLDLVEFTD